LSLTMLAAVNPQEAVVDTYKYLFSKWSFF
jgi:hypothetical protein